MTRVFISYTHDSPEHKDRILSLSNRLRDDGLECYIDQYEDSPDEGWPLWCERQIERAVFVLVACTETYLCRFKGEETPQIGLGATWEGHVITQQLYNAQGRNKKFIPILLVREDWRFIPLTLQSATAYQLPHDYNPLYRRLTGQPFISMPNIGTVKNMAVRELPYLPSLEPKPGFQTLWNVPYPRNPFFTGRETILETLRQDLEKRSSAALIGLGGIGKTQTALEYAYRYRPQYRAVFWTRAESRDTLLTDFAYIAIALQLPSAYAEEQEIAVSEVRRWLETHSGWLLIFDNADDLAVTKEFVPPGATGHLLFTTRVQGTGGFAERISLFEMSPEESVLLLLRRAKVIGTETPLIAAKDDERTVAVQISQQLGGLPLALDQAGAFIEETPSTLSEYITLYEAKRNALLAERGSLGDHPSVTVTFSLAFANVGKNNAGAADLLRVCAFLAPEAIPEEIFTEGGIALGDNLAIATSSHFAFVTVMREAGRFSLIRRNPQTKTLNVHRLVQAVIQDDMPKAEQKEWAQRAVHCLAAIFPDATFQNWASCQRLLPHARACASLILTWKMHSKEAADLFNQMGGYLHERALLTEAEPLFHHSLAILEHALGPDHPDLAKPLNNLAGLYAKQGKYSETEPLLQRSLRIRRQALGPNHPDVATCLNNLAMLYNSQGRYSKAEPLLRRALTIWEKSLGPDDRLVATAMYNLAMLYDSQGKYVEAESLYRRSLIVCEQALGSDHPDVAKTLNSLAAVYRTQGKYNDAESLFQRALEISEKALGPDHPDVATNLNNLAVLYSSRGKFSEAEPLLQRSLEIRRQVFGADHLDVATSLNNLGVLYKDQRNYSQAEPLIQHALAIRENALGPDHSEVANALSNLATVHMANGTYSKAEPLLKRAIAVSEQALGLDHPDVATYLNNLAGVYESRQKYNNAEPLLRRALVIWEQAFGANHPHVAVGLSGLGRLHFRQENYAGAEPLLERSLAIRQQALGRDHPDVATGLCNLAMVYKSQGKYSKAEPLLRRALGIWEKLLGADHSEVAQTLYDLAIVYKSQGKYSKSEPLLERARGIWEKALAPDPSGLLVMKKRSEPTK